MNKKKSAHRMAWEITNGPIPNGLFVLHRCDNPACVNPDHLFLGTQLTNIRDAMTKGRMPLDHLPEASRIAAIRRTARVEARKAIERMTRGVS